MVTYPINAPMEDAHCKSLILKSPLGKGVSRVVYPVDGDPLAVIKEVHVPFVGSNMMEWLIWSAVRDTSLRKLFGECLAISTTGRFLIMERLDDIAKSEWQSIPAMPEWLNDLKPENFGKNAAGQIKIRDYVLVQLGTVLEAAPTQRQSWQGQR